jgi:hypothetical protein
MNGCSSRPLLFSTQVYGQTKLISAGEQGPSLVVPPASRHNAGQEVVEARNQGPSASGREVPSGRRKYKEGLGADHRQVQDGILRPAVGMELGHRRRSLGRASAQRRGRLIGRRRRASAGDLEGGQHRGLLATGKKVAAQAMLRGVGKKAGRPAGKTADGSLGGRGACRHQGRFGREGSGRRRRLTGRGRRWRWLPVTRQAAAARGRYGRRRGSTSSSGGARRIGGAWGPCRREDQVGGEQGLCSVLSHILLEKMGAVRA